MYKRFSKQSVTSFALILLFGTLIASPAVSKVNINDEEGLDMVQGNIKMSGSSITNVGEDGWKGIKFWGAGNDVLSFYAGGDGAISINSNGANFYKPIHMTENIKMNENRIHELSEISLGGDSLDSDYRGSINKVDKIYRGDGSWPGIEFTNNGIEFWGGYGERHLEVSGDNERVELHSDLNANFKDIKDVNVLDVNGCNGCDIAETVEMEGSSLEKGEVVSISKNGKLVKSSSRYDEEVAGVVSSNPVILMGNKNGGASFGNIASSGNNSHIIETSGGKREVNLALTGLVPVKVSDVNGAITPGDKLATSNISGYAMKAEPIMERNGRKVYGSGIIGKAMEPLESGKGKIQMLASIE
jgi:hypothetical protein